MKKTMNDISLIKTINTMEITFKYQEAKASWMNT